MKRQTMYPDLEEEVYDDLSTSVPNSAHINSDEKPSPFLRKRRHESDSETLSQSSSQKTRKKRNSYQKIPDEIRLGLLDAVKNGETLKSVAKRYKINYSSAKSILHTYRKEGRIHKKSAQERSKIKKKGSNPKNSESDVPLKPAKRKSDAINKPSNPKTREVALPAEEKRSEEPNLAVNPEPADHDLYNNEAMTNKLMKLYNSQYEYAPSQTENYFMAPQEQTYLGAREAEEYGQNSSRLFENFHHNFIDLNFMGAKLNMMYGDACKQQQQQQQQQPNFSQLSEDLNLYDDDVDTKWHTKSSLPEDFSVEPAALLQMKNQAEPTEKREPQVNFQNYMREGNWYPPNVQYYMNESLKRNSNLRYPEVTAQNIKSSMGFF